MDRRPRPAARTRRLVVVLVVAVTLGTLVGWLFVWPPHDQPGRVDAVLVLAGGDGEREAAGIRLVRDGVAPVIVFSDGGRPGAPSARRCLLRVDGVRVDCLRPETSSTRGEARAFAELAGREGWRSVAVVTSSYHLRRASLLVGRCYRGTVRPVAAGMGHVGSLEPVGSVLREGAALLAAGTVQRPC